VQNSNITNADMNYWGKSDFFCDFIIKNLKELSGKNQIFMAQQ